MARYIDADATVEALRRAESLVKAFGYHNVIETVREMPFADVAPIRHGRWEPYDDYSRWRCSECGFFIEVDIIDEITVTERSYPKFCPNCGAKMDGESDA